MARMPLTGYVSVQLGGFLHPFLQTVPPSYARPIEDLVLPVVGADSTMVSRLARRMSWGPREMIHREKRLCRHAKTRSLDDVGLSAALRTEAGLYLQQDSLVLLDTSDLSKPYARKMWYLGTVQDGSRKTTTPGYWLVGAFLRCKRGGRGRGNRAHPCGRGLPCPDGQERHDDDRTSLRARAAPRRAAQVPAGRGGLDRPGEGG